EAARDRAQGGQVPPRDRRSRLRHQNATRAPVPGRKEQGQGDHDVSRSPSGAPRARTGRARSRRHIPRRHRQDRERGETGREVDDDDPHAEIRDFAMPKMKTHKGAKKRFSITGGGKVKRYKAFKSHILTKKTSKRKRRL